MKIIYVAGPYRGHTIAQTKNNIRMADMWGEIIVDECGIMPFVPHANTAFYDGLASEEFFLEGTMEFLRRCDAVYLTPGWRDSAGAVAEKAEAEKLGIPVFESIPAVKVWCCDE